MDRRALVAVALAAMVGLSGCALLTGETLEFEASQATVSDSALGQAQYEEVGIEQKTVNRSFAVAGQEREVRLTNWVASYQRDLGGTASPAPGTVSVLSTPEVSIAGQTLNPIASLSPRELLDNILQQYSGISDISQAGTRNVTILGAERTVTSFTGTIEYEGQEVDVRIHLATATHEGDVIVAVAVHPEMIPPDQAGVDTMFQGIEHTGSDD